MKFDGSLLKLHRRHAGLSQEEVARRARVTVTTVSRLERGLHEPGASMLATIAEVIDVPLASLFIPNGDEASEPAHLTREGPAE